MPKTKKTIRVLAIDPGSRYVGLAVLEDKNSLKTQPELVYYHVKTLKNRNVPRLHLQEVREVISEFISTYRPNAVVQEKIWFVQSKASERLKQIFQEIKKQVKRKKISYAEHAPTTVRQYICQSGGATRRETAKILASIYPELKFNLTQDSMGKEKYWQNAFDAVALGLCCLENLRDRV